MLPLSMKNNHVNQRLYRSYYGVYGAGLQGWMFPSVLLLVIVLLLDTRAACDTEHHGFLLETPQKVGWCHKR